MTVVTRSLLNRPLLLTLLLAALLTARVGGAHLHLCFDGSEPPASLHFSDAGHHDDHHADEAHDDVDVSLIAEAAAKLGKLSLDLPLLVTASLILFGLWLAAQRPPSPYRGPRAASDPYSLRPPVRGPPRLISP